jgi:hypothetical protein
MTQVRPGPKKDTHRTQELVRARWHNAAQTLIRMRTTEAHYIIGPDHPRWEEAKAVVNPYLGEPEAIEIPAFLKAPETPPPELADLIEYADTPAQSNEKLFVRLREVLGLIGLAEDAGGRAAPELYRRRDRLESGIQWNRGRMAETI